MSSDTISQESEEHGARVVFLVPKNHVKTVKSALERAGQLDRSSKIVPEARSESRQPNTDNNVDTPPQDHVKFPRLVCDFVKGEYVEPSRKHERSPDREHMHQPRMCIPTTLSYPPGIGETSADLIEESGHEFKSALLRSLRLDQLFQDIALAHHTAVDSFPKSPLLKSPVHKALYEALSAIQKTLLANLDLTPEALVSAFPDGYSVYKPMLLLPSNAFASSQWKKLFPDGTAYPKMLEPVWRRVSEAVGATHVAVNSPIPPATDATSHVDGEAGPTQENILRSPVNLTPVYGDFGPHPTSRTISSPTVNDFAQALWVETKQNGIWQIWAPLYTMFSRGNIREKTRILNLPSVTNDFDVPSAAVDLYAGIGYFAFSYKKSGENREHGIQRLMCWELNPWSVEGLRRGAEKNGWTCKIIQGEHLSRLHTTDTGVQDLMSPPLPSDGGLQDVDFWVFQASNEGAKSDYASMATRWGDCHRWPIRHINLGLLPTSRLSWSVAVDMLDEQRGGWIHVHENIGIRDIKSKTKETEEKMQNLANAHNGSAVGKQAKVEHVEWVKMYAPGVVHCVLDVHVSGAL
ncbi:trna wybutosine-synthesizing protein 2 [Stemphylium lycopersici]|uniref:tRNA(Phe) (4-demethylwyosine(37)-C(7)) aminocarboxypropyltransferase n=1 Tax=Stemphylium lycopersici TaxID=183478 RepID=A0A364N1L0_STELY|nr:trna wybutosine-synthesizing protein 2 [Stemphylium lycopersici]